MIKSLIKKEFRLTAHPMTFVMSLFGMMVLIPNYPYTVAIFYICLGLFFAFVNGRENKDLYYTSVLPIAKKDVVKSKCIFTVIIEIFSLIFTIPFAILSIKINPNADNMAGIDPNVSFFGFALLIFSIFNYIFITSFFKTGYKVGISFLKATIPTAIVMIAVEVLAHIPAIAIYIDATSAESMIQQLPILACGIVLYVLSTILTVKKASANFEKVDL